MRCERYISLIADIAKEQGKKYEDLSLEEQTKLLLLIPEIHQLISDKVKEILDPRKD